MLETPFEKLSIGAVGSPGTLRSLRGKLGPKVRDGSDHMMQQMEYEASMDYPYQ